MVRSTSLTLYAIIAISSAFAAPIQLRASINGTEATSGKNSTTPDAKSSSNQNEKNSTSTSLGAGAAYFMTNDAKNLLVVNKIDTTGKLSFSKAIKTGGKGSVGKGGGPDALFSQNSVKVSGQHVLAVNAGSNTVSAFSINPKDATDIKLLGQPQGTGGEFPVTVASNPTKRTNVCVLNGGAKNGVKCFNVDAKKGLQPVRNAGRSLKLKQTTPPSGPAKTVSDLLFTEDGKQLIASVKGSGPNDKGFLAAWDVANDGSLSKDFLVIPASSGALPFGMSRVSGSKQNAFFVTDPAVGATSFDINTSISEARKLVAEKENAKKNKNTDAEKQKAQAEKQKADAEKQKAAKSAKTNSTSSGVVNGKNATATSVGGSSKNSTSTSISSEGKNATSSAVVSSNGEKNAKLSENSSGKNETSKALTGSSNSTSTVINAATTAIPVQGQGAICWSARSPKTGSFFTTDILTSTVTEIALDDSLKGKVVKQYPLTKGSATIDATVASLKQNDFLYVLAPNGTVASIDVLAVGAKAGEATTLQTFEVGNALKKAKISFKAANMQGMAVFVQ